MVSAKLNPHKFGVRVMGYRRGAPLSFRRGVGGEVIMIGLRGSGFGPDSQRERVAGYINPNHLPPRPYDYYGDVEESRCSTCKIL